jgi:hypothetical protein
MLRSPVINFRCGTKRNNLPVTHLAQLFHHNHSCDLPKTRVCCAPPSSISDVGLNPTISPSHIVPNSSITTIRVISRRRKSNSLVTTSPLTHWTQLFHHNHSCDLPRRYPDLKSNSSVTTIRVTHRRRSRAPPSPCDPRDIFSGFSDFCL